jgi:structure-specific recognition protein 1
MLSRMQTITLQPGEELRVICAGAGAAAGPAEPGSGGGKRKNARKTRKAQAGGKRAANPFMKFAAKERKNIMGQNPGMAMTDVGKELGKRWRSLSDAEKSKY